jgi:hypothetical protein
MKAIPVPVIVFEDGLLPEPTDASESPDFKMPYSIKISDAESLSFFWQDRWNPLGGNCPAEMESVQIDSLKVFAEAVAFTKMFSGYAVVICDMRLNNSADHKDLLLETNIIKAACGKEYDSLAKLWPRESDYQKVLWRGHLQGLLLAMGIAANPKSICDLILASTMADSKFLKERAIPLLEEIASRANNQVRISTESSLTIGSYNVLAERFKDSFQRFADRFLIADIGERLWPSQHTAWFSNNNAPPHVPHHKSNLSGEHYVTYREELSAYLRKLTGRTHLPPNWHDGVGLHNTLKHLIGGDAVAHVGPNYPDGTRRKYATLGAIVLLLAAAESDERCVPSADDWLAKTYFEETAGEAICPDVFDLRQSREALLSLHKFFRGIVKSEGEDNKGSSNVLDVSWSLDLSVTRLRIDLAIDSQKPDPGKRTALLEKISNRPWRSSHNGGVTGRYFSMRNAFKSSKQGAEADSVLDVTVYPVQTNSRPATRLEFNVAVSS